MVSESAGLSEEARRRGRTNQINLEIVSQLLSGNAVACYRPNSPAFKLICLSAVLLLKYSFTQGTIQAQNANSVLLLVSFQQNVKLFEFIEPPSPVTNCLSRRCNLSAKTNGVGGLLAARTVVLLGPRCLFTARLARRAPLAFCNALVPRHQDTFGNCLQRLI